MQRKLFHLRLVSVVFVFSVVRHHRTAEAEGGFGKFASGRVDRALDVRALEEVVRVQSRLDLAPMRILFKHITEHERRGQALARPGTDASDRMENVLKLGKGYRVGISLGPEKHTTWYVVYRQPVRVGLTEILTRTSRTRLRTWSRLCKAPGRVSWPSSSPSSWSG